MHRKRTLLRLTHVAEQHSGQQRQQGHGCALVRRYVLVEFVYRATVNLTNLPQIALIEPNAMPGNNTFVAGFAQCEHAPTVLPCPYTQSISQQTSETPARTREYSRVICPGIRY